MNGLLVIVLGVLLIYLAISGRIDPLIQSLKVAFSSESADASTDSATKTPAIAPTSPIATPQQTQAQKILDSVLSNKTTPPFVGT